MTRYEKMRNDIKTKEIKKVNGYIYFGAYWYFEGGTHQDIRDSIIFEDIIKIGMTTGSLEARASQISSDKGKEFTTLKAIKVTNTTKEYLEFLESLIRVLLSGMQGISSIYASHDHFHFTDDKIKNSIHNFHWYDELSEKLFANLFNEAQKFNFNTETEITLEENSISATLVDFTNFIIKDKDN